MKIAPEHIDDKANSAIAVGLRMAFIAFLLLLSFNILAPFILPIVWGIIISIAVYPLFKKLSHFLGDREKLASSFIVFLGIAIFVVPFALVIMNSVQGIEVFVDQLDSGTFKLPAPPEKYKEWPLIGNQLYDLWLASSNNLMILIVKLKPYLTEYLPTIFSSAAGVVGTIFQFIFSVIIAGILLVNADGGEKVASGIFKTFIGKEGDSFVTLSKGTIKGVVQGVLGTAILQSIFLGIGMFVAGVPAAGIWTVLVLIVAIIQLPPTLVMIPIIIYMFSLENTTVAVVFAIWSIVWSVSDNVIKPILMGRGVEVPMVVMLLGSIGGMLAYGIIGLFIGSVALAITYKIVIALGKRNEA